MAHTIANIRNVALVGHNGAGKTSLAEVMLLHMGRVSRLGRVADGTTVSDYDRGEVERKMSLRLSLLNGEWRSCHFNILDAPGYMDFIADAKTALRVADAAAVVIDAVGGIEIGTERVWAFAGEYRLPRFLFVNKLDRPDCSFEQVMEKAEERFGRQVVALQMPVGGGEGFGQVVDLVRMKGLAYQGGKAEEGDVPAGAQEQAQRLRERLVEAVAETDETLMEKYFNEGELSAEELTAGLRRAVLQQQLFPVFCGDAHNGIGVDQLMDALVQYGPAPSESPSLQALDKDGGTVTLDVRAEAPLAALVFKTLGEQHVGDLNLLRLYSGAIKPGDEVLNAAKNASERIGQIFQLNGRERTELTEAKPGDIVALVKLKNTHTGNTLCARNKPVSLPAIEYPEPLIRVAISGKEKGAEERLVTGFAHLHEEDPSFVFRYDPEIRQSLVFAQGDLHLGTLIDRLKERYGVEINLEPPRIPYRETIKGRSEGHHRHKKQTGGRGQFAEVFLRVEPKDRGQGFEFLDEVVGGSIPNNFIPAVEKGIIETLVEGPVAKYKVVDVAAAVHDGKFHAVDSDEFSFKIAGSMAFKDAFLKAKPILLEPIYSLTITIPEEFMGDVMGDLSSRRGRISGIDTDGHFQIIHAEAPLAEIDRYATNLRSMTQGKGMHTQKLERYEEVPREIMERIVQEAIKQQAA